jgi:hemerythrin
MIELVDYLETYADKHFKYEEACMESFRCPVHAKNKDAHNQFLNYFSRFKEESKVVGFRRELLVELHETISHWIEGHILHVDTKLRPCIKGRGH